MNNDFPITIFHNRDCGTSRNTLAMLLAAGYEPNIVEYLSAGWTRAQLEGLLADMNLTPRALLRDKGTSAAELGLLGNDAQDDAILDAMIRHPILVNRPIVVTPKGTKLCRPSEVVFVLLDRVPESFTKEDGEVVRRDGY
ncbi:MAG TPA: arsenate reductase (glutaredoxin) [Hyphomonas sp.]|uniref:Arsenate reductase n=1 Tax=Hyphomonas polymorpha PS728 TaxID=1280954 RepID=A0A062VHF8_9PROT|nr:arsenate reductase (glutaredoxin) [Hyphomonas polymorpha]KCZ97990.1 arsenate reductase [Hyphomonas polymorpha PS728]HRI99512.1 arsenate reductase (glutaredoxin) [Hyphomonas sp.]HRK65908.1 arsenate reductase (glutaredoxin) [Hyphomonas sp.]